jgi:aminoglycoside phosphotransferase (APT) family kinase protein
MRRLASRWRRSSRPGCSRCCRWPCPGTGFSSDGTAPAFSGYDLLPGTPALRADTARLDLRRIGSLLGDFLQQLHAADPAEAAALGVPDDDDPSREAWQEQAGRDLWFTCSRRLLPASSMTNLSALLDERPEPFAGSPVLLHGDLAAEHVLVDDHGMPIGVIDWSDAMIGDPAMDLAGLLHWGGTPMIAAASRTWGTLDDALLHRARWFATCRALADIVHGATEGDSVYVDAGVRALSTG